MNEIIKIDVYSCSNCHEVFTAEEWNKSNKMCHYLSVRKTTIEDINIDDYCCCPGCCEITRRGNLVNWSIPLEEGKTITRKIEIECIVADNCSNDIKIPFEVGKKVTAEWIEIVGNKYIKEKNNENGGYYREHIYKVFDKKINGMDHNNFLVDMKNKLLICYKIA